MSAWLNESHSLPLKAPRKTERVRRTETNEEREIKSERTRGRKASPGPSGL